MQGNAKAGQAGRCLTWARVIAAGRSAGGGCSLPPPPLATLLRSSRGPLALAAAAGPCLGVMSAQAVINPHHCLGAVRDRDADSPSRVGAGLERPGQATLAPTKALRCL